jgi:hypothetical protein
MIRTASNGHFFTQMPQPLGSSVRRGGERRGEGRRGEEREEGGGEGRRGGERRWGVKQE